MLANKRTTKMSLEVKFIFLAVLAAVLFLTVSYRASNYDINNVTNKERVGEMLRSGDFVQNTTRNKKYHVNNETGTDTKQQDRGGMLNVNVDFIQSTITKIFNMTIITSDRDTGTTCSCDIVSTDCLNSINCLPNHDASLRTVAAGIQMRRLMKQSANFNGAAYTSGEETPVGKTFQYKAIMAWQSWVNENTLPLYHEPCPDYIFFSMTHDKKYCTDRKLVGFDCYFTSINKPEELDIIEQQALPYLDGNVENQKIMEQSLTDIQTAVKRNEEHKIAPLDRLLSMAHILRMLFNRRETLQELSNRTLVFSGSDNKEPQNQSSPLRVSLHLRRADACMADGKLVNEASPLNSTAQQFALRKCYATNVYMDALQRTLDIVRRKDPKRQVQVFISSDDPNSLLDEVRDQFPELYKTVLSWHIIDIDRQQLNYQGFVEDRTEHSNHGILGDSAVSDLWLLSNGEVFIGHLGSRFGKVAYLLATARHNRFVPFFSVDGHSVCCEIDEPCGEMKPYISTMSDCLTFSHDLEEGKGNFINSDYFEVGSYLRKKLVQVRSGEEPQNAESEMNTDWVSGVSKTVTTDNPWADLTAPVADYEYFPETGRGQSVEEPVFEFDKSKCSSLILDTTPPRVRPPSDGACEGFDGVLLIQQGDKNGGSAMVFFLYVIGQLQYAEQHNLKPWIHLNTWSQVIYDQSVHSQRRGPITFTMMNGMEIGWERDGRDVEGNLFPGRPRLRSDQNQLQRKVFSVEGTGVWDHYFMPVSDFSPGDVSCENLPLLTMDYDMIAPGLHYQAPWAPRAWRISAIEYIERHDLDFDVWIEPKRSNAAKYTKNYIRLNADIQQRANCAHPKQDNSLGLHIRHGDKATTRERIPLSDFFPYAKAFVENGGGSIYVATDSSLVIDEITTEWPKYISSHISYQDGITLSSNETATFDLGVSHHQINTEALTETLALSKCTYLVHGLSAMSEAAMYLNPSLIERSVNLEHEDQDSEVMYAKFLKMIHSEEGK